jgi:hypothetical protein
VHAGHYGAAHLSYEVLGVLPATNEVSGPLKPAPKWKRNQSLLPSIAYFGRNKYEKHDDANGTSDDRSYRFHDSDKPSDREDCEATCHHPNSTAETPLLHNASRVILRSANQASPV